MERTTRAISNGIIKNLDNNISPTPKGEPKKIGCMHYWDVWHGKKDIDAFKHHGVDLWLSMAFNLIHPWKPYSILQIVSN